MHRLFDWAEEVNATYGKASISSWRQWLKKCKYDGQSIEGFLAAQKLNPKRVPSPQNIVLEYRIFTHQMSEEEKKKLQEFLEDRPDFTTIHRREEEYEGIFFGVLVYEARFDVLAEDGKLIITGDDCNGNIERLFQMALISGRDEILTFLKQREEKIYRRAEESGRKISTPPVEDWSTFEDGLDDWWLYGSAVMSFEVGLKTSYEMFHHEFKITVS